MTHKQILLTNPLCINVGQIDSNIQYLPQAQKNELQHFLFLVYTHGCGVNDCHRMQLSVRTMTYGVGNVEAALCSMDAPLQ